jgi:uncharacterized membrane protein YgcG
VSDLGAVDETGRACGVEKVAKATWRVARGTKSEVTIRYRVNRGLIRHEEGDELYWNVTGNEWEAPIRSVEATISLPKSVPMSAIRALAFTGPVGSARQDFTINHTEQILFYQVSRPLRPREGLTVAVGWPSGHVHFPSRWQELGWFLLDQRWFALPLLILAGCLFAWQGFGRDPLRLHSIKPEYEPPAALKPGEAGTLVDETAHPRDIVATVVDLAVRGHLTIERVETAFGEEDYLLKLSKPWLGDETVAPFEVVILAQLFGGEGATKMKLLSEVRRDSRAVVPPIRDQIYRDLVEKKYFLASPHAVRRFWSLLGLFLFLVPAGVAWAASGGGEVLPPSLSMLSAFAASGLVVLAFARAMPRKTLRGARAKNRILGFQEFLERAEKDRLRRLPPESLHEWLPYAIALGVEEAWISGFEGIEVTAPPWYESRTPFTLHGYSGRIRRFSREAENAWLTSRRSSEGAWAAAGRSGFRGGSAGGGFGGGGGGTF